MVVRTAFAILVPTLAALSVNWFALAQQSNGFDDKTLRPPPVGFKAKFSPLKDPIDFELPPKDGRAGETKATRRTVAAALHWLARHQMPQGNWSLQKYTDMCKDPSCTGAASQESLSAATALALLPFLAAGQPQTKDGPFQKTVATGIDWLVSHQKADGDLSADAESQMYSHGLAAIALCEDYGMTQDKRVGAAAQKAIDFIEAAQNAKTGGWRYHPGESGDTSVFAWQFTALKSAQIAGLSVKAATVEGAKEWLASCAAGEDKVGQFSYVPKMQPTPSMTAIGVLSNQYLHADRSDPVVVVVVDFLMANQPESDHHNIYYWYYAAQVLHNVADKNWDTWNRKMRKIIVESQSRQGCAAGSWDPKKPISDKWGSQGGRIMVTGLSCLTLEIYYRRLNFYQLDKAR